MKLRLNNPLGRFILYTAKISFHYVFSVHINWLQNSDLKINSIMKIVIINYQQYFKDCSIYIFRTLKKNNEKSSSAVHKNHLIRTAHLGCFAPRRKSSGFVDETNTCQSFANVWNVKNPLNKFLSKNR